jgi:hypothetical protein
VSLARGKRNKGVYGGYEQLQGTKSVSIWPVISYKCFSCFPRPIILFLVSIAS